MKHSSGHRPKCSVPGCSNDAAHQVGKNHPNYPQYRRSSWILNAHPHVKVGDHYCCGKCHGKNTAKKHGVKSPAHLTALRNGFSCPTAWKNSTHPYLQYRKSYCENKDGRLGFDCPCDGVVPWDGMLDVDHITGDHSKVNGHWKNDENLLQTLCKCCHAWKSVTYGDHFKWEDKTPQQQQMVYDLIHHNYMMQYAPANVIVKKFKKTIPGNALAKVINKTTP